MPPTANGRNSVIYDLLQCIVVDSISMTNGSKSTFLNDFLNNCQITADY